MCCKCNGPAGLISSVSVSRVGCQNEEMAEYYLYEKNILTDIMTALVIEYPLLHTISSALCIPQIDRDNSRELLNSLLSGNIKSAGVKGMGGGGWRRALSVYNCFLTRWPTFPVPVSER